MNEERGDAEISADGMYRHWLTRYWGTGPRVLFAMLNPSTADANRDDATIRKCRGFASRLGCDGFEVVNLFDYRTSSPAELKAAGYPISTENDRHIRAALARAQSAGAPIVAAWGSHAPWGRVREVAAWARWMCLGTTIAGSPRHPLYLNYDTPLVPWNFEEKP